MKKLLLLTFSVASLALNGFGQSDIKMQSKYGSEDIDLMSVLRFDEISLEKLTFTSEALKGKDFQIRIKEIVNGKEASNDVVFDSHEDEYFKIKSDKFIFRVLMKIRPENMAKFDFQFNGFSKQKTYKVGASEKGFTSKNFMGGHPEMAIPVNADTYILTFMMPYKKKDGSMQYCEVAQSGINPEDFGKKYKIPRYFLIGIKFQ